MPTCGKESIDGKAVHKCGLPQKGRSLIPFLSAQSREKSALHKAGENRNGTRYLGTSQVLGSFHRVDCHVCDATCQPSDSNVVAFRCDSGDAVSVPGATHVRSHAGAVGIEVWTTLVL